MNESMLTGESIPVVKNEIPSGNHSVASECDQKSNRLSEEDQASPDSRQQQNEESLVYNPEKHKNHTLYAGTKVIQTRTLGREKVLAMVSRTSFNTSKGRLVLSILYPKPTSFRFYRDSWNFIGVLSILAFIGFGFTVYALLKHHTSPYLIVVRGMSLITIIVPPALPVAMTMGIAFAIVRLKKQKVFCTSPPRINIAGKLKMMCFDKTGTLTEDGLDFYGTRPCVRGNNSAKFLDLSTHCATLPLEIQRSMAACHGLIWLGDRLIGDPLEVKIFEATGWTLIEPESAQSPPASSAESGLSGLAASPPIVKSPFAHQNSKVRQWSREPSNDC